MTTPIGQRSRTMAALNILAKWRALFTGWQLGTRPKGDPEGDAVRDHREVTILLRAEMSALTELLIDKGIITQQEFEASLEAEAKHLCADYEKRFPGVEATPDGLSMDRRVLPWMKGWKP